MGGQKKYTYSFSERLGPSLAGTDDLWAVVTLRGMVAEIDDVAWTGIGA